MAFEPQDIERMIMQAHYKEAVTQPSSCDDDMSDMEREQYRKQIRELMGAVETLLDANRSIGEQLNEANSAIGALQDYVNTLENKIKKLEGKVDDAHTDDDDEKEAGSGVSSRSS